MPQLASNIISYKLEDKTQLERLFSKCNALSDAVKTLKDSINRYNIHKEKKNISMTGLVNDNRS